MELQGSELSVRNPRFAPLLYRMLREQPPPASHPGTPRPGLPWHFCMKYFICSTIALGSLSQRCSLISPPLLSFFQSKVKNWPQQWVNTSSLISFGAVLPSLSAAWRRRTRQPGLCRTGGVGAGAGILPSDAYWPWVWTPCRQYFPDRSI